MSERIDVDAAKAWLDAVPGGGIGDSLAQRWQRFATIDAPVVTVYGSYDTGKSSLLRRLLIELGQAVPSWLTISARHETFEVNEIRAGGCVLRDTPGFVIEGADARAEMNTELASDAVALTDVAIVVVPPQLATAEYSMLRELTQQDWVSGSLWFVISRFDEAGVDPEDDSEGYRALAEHKIGELRSSLGLSPDVSVHVVCQDFAQMAGAERNPDPSIWDGTREWDGIAELLAAIVDVGRASYDGLRHSAAERFWGTSVRKALEQLRHELETHLDNTVVSDEGDQRRASWLAQLDTLIRAAEADLRGRISGAIGDAVDSADPATRFAQALKTSVGAWHAACERDVNKLLRSVGEAVATDRARPDWRQFEEMTAAMRREPADAAEGAQNALIYTPVVTQVGAAVLNALREYDQYRGVKSRPATPDNGGLTRIAAAAIGVNVITELTGIAEKFVSQQRATDHQRDVVQSDLTDVGGQAETLALESLHALADDARQRIRDATVDQSELRDGLHRLVKELRTHIAAGEELLAGT